MAAEERTEVRATLAYGPEGWTITWSNEALLVPTALAQSWARRILGLAPDNRPYTDVGAAAAAAARAAEGGVT
jgi:hypothetical protein